VQTILPLVRVACAVITNSAGLVFIAKRSASMKQPNKWEFPGGKIEGNEMPFETVTREIKEEFKLTIQPQSLIGTFRYSYPEFEIALVAVHCFLADENQIPLLAEHTAYCWVPPEYLLEFDLSLADVALAAHLSQFKSGNEIEPFR